MNNDLISRQAAIDLLRKWSGEYAYIETPTGSAVKEFEALPSVQPRKGMWCMTPDGKLVCSCCYENPTNRIIVNGDLIYDMTPIRKRMKFCPNCGADMRGEENETD